MTFEDTPEYQLSLAMRPACDAVLCSVYGVQPAAIQRFPKGSAKFILDKEYAIDMEIRLANNALLLGQEKTLRNCFYHFRTFTMEFYQNRFTKEPGEFFKIASQFYLHGYADPAGVRFVEWHIICIFKFIDWLKRCPVASLERRLKPAGGSRAAFLPIPYDRIPERFIHASFKQPTDEELI